MGSSGAAKGGGGGNPKASANEASPLEPEGDFKKAIDQLEEASRTALRTTKVLRGNTREAYDLAVDMIRIASSQGMSVALAPREHLDLNGVRGLSTSTRLVVPNTSAFGANMRSRVVAHELAHTYHSRTGRIRDHDSTGATGHTFNRHNEMVAEVASYLVNRHFKVKTTSSASSVIGRHGPLTPEARSEAAGVARAMIRDITAYRAPKEHS